MQNDYSGQINFEVKTSSSGIFLKYDHVGTVTVQQSQICGRKAPGFSRAIFSGRAAS